MGLRLPWQSPLTPLEGGKTPPPVGHPLSEGELPDARDGTYRKDETNKTNRIMKATRITALVALLVMAGGVKMHGQEASEINQISAEQKVYELSVLWKEMSYNFGNLDNCPGLDIDSLYRAFLPKVTETKDDFEYWKMLQRFMACFNNGHTKIFGAPDLLVKHLAYPMLKMLQ